MRRLFLGLAFIVITQAALAACADNSGKDIKTSGHIEVEGSHNF